LFWRHIADLENIRESSRTEEGKAVHLERFMQPLHILAKVHFLEHVKYHRTWNVACLHPKIQAKTIPCFPTNASLLPNGAVVLKIP
jgi:hypothetical protein